MKLVDFILVMLSILFACLGLGLIIEFFFYEKEIFLTCSAVLGGLALGTAAAAFCRYLITHEEVETDICFLLFLIGLGSVICSVSLRYFI
ncbi:MAG: hypothetical protein J6U60_03200 [Clostridia bacterium]|nr:hypothetical protein [Clostridia bacterium]